MCNLYRMTKAPAEVVRWFDSEVGSVGNAGGEVYPGYPGLVFARGKARSMFCRFRPQGSSREIM